MILADVKWIKINVDMFDNRKIKHLRRLPDGDSIVLIWVMLLTLAGRCNARGMVFLTEDIPYTPKMLANEFGLDESTVVLALKSFEELGMVSTTDNSFLLVNGWEKYQNVVGMEKIREQTRNRVAKHREKQKLLPGNVTGNVNVPGVHLDDISINRHLPQVGADPFCMELGHLLLNQSAFFLCNRAAQDDGAFPVCHRAASSFLHKDLGLSQQAILVFRE